MPVYALQYLKRLCSCVSTQPVAVWISVLLWCRCVWETVSGLTLQLPVSFASLLSQQTDFLPDWLPVFHFTRLFSGLHRLISCRHSEHRPVPGLPFFLIFQFPHTKFQYTLSGASRHWNEHKRRRWNLEKIYARGTSRKEGFLRTNGVRHVRRRRLQVPSENVWRRIKTKFNSILDNWHICTNVRSGTFSQPGFRCVLIQLYIISTSSWNILESWPTLFRIRISRPTSGGLLTQVWYLF